MTSGRTTRPWTPATAAAVGIAARVGHGVGDDDRAALAGRDGQDVAAIERADRQDEQAGHAAAGAHRPDHARLAVHQRDHRQVVAQVGAEPQHGVERLVDVVRVDPRGRDPEEGVEQVADGLQGVGPLGDPPLESRRASAPSSSVIRLKARPSAPISSAEVTSLRTVRSPAATAAEVRASRLIGRANRRAIALEATSPTAIRPPPRASNSRRSRADRLVGLGRVDLGDQAPVGVADPQRPVGHQHVHDRGSRSSA